MEVRVIQMCKNVKTPDSRKHLDRHKGAKSIQVCACDLPQGPLRITLMRLCAMHWAFSSSHSLEYVEESDPHTGATTVVHIVFLHTHSPLEGSAGSLSHTAPKPHNFPRQPAKHKD